MNESEKFQKQEGHALTIFYLSPEASHRIPNFPLKQILYPRLRRKNPKTQSPKRISTDRPNFIAIKSLYSLSIHIST
jgi:hypothetical protein